MSPRDETYRRRRILRSPILWIGLGIFVCVALMMLNAVLYFSHPHGRGLNLFAAIWCGVMALFVLSAIRSL